MADLILQQEKARIATIKRNILIADLVYATALIVLYHIAYAYFVRSVRWVIDACLLIIQSGLLALFAIKIGGQVKRQTGKQPRYGLILIHVINLVIFCSLLGSHAWILIKQNQLKERAEAGDCQSKLKYTRFTFYENITWMTTQMLWWYCDMFLVYLLLRFSRTEQEHTPRNNSCILEGYISCEENIVQDMKNQVQINSEEKQARIAAEQSRLFIDAVLQ